MDLKLILELHKKWLDNKSDGIRADLSNSDRSNANLSGANLSSADLSGANLSSADLSGANIINTCVKGFYLGKHFAFYHNEVLKVGCHEHHIEFWLNNFEQIGKEAGYTEDQIAAYGFIIQWLFTEHLLEAIE